LKKSHATGHLLQKMLYWAPDVPVSELRAKWAPPPSKFVRIAGMDVHLRDEGLREYE